MSISYNIRDILHNASWSKKKKKIRKEEEENWIIESCFALRKQL